MHAIAQLYKWLIFCPWQKIYKYKLYFDTSNQVIFFAHSFNLWNLSYEIIQFEVQEDVFFISNKINEGK